MADINLDSCHNRHRTKSLTNGKKVRGDGYPNILRNQDFSIVLRIGLVSDITYLRTGEGFKYYCVIKDIVTGVRKNGEGTFVMNTILGMIVKHNLEERCIFHSDKRSQLYIKSSYGIVETVQITSEFLPIGIPGDNA